MTRVPPGTGAGRPSPEDGRPVAVADEIGLDDVAEYDGGLRATAESGKVAIFRGAGQQAGALLDGRGPSPQPRSDGSTQDTTDSIAVDAGSAAAPPSVDAAVGEPAPPATPAAPTAEAQQEAAGDGPRADLDSPFLGLFQDGKARIAGGGNGHAALEALDPAGTARAPEDLRAPRRGPNGLTGRQPGQATQPARNWNPATPPPNWRAVPAAPDLPAPPVSPAQPQVMPAQPQVMPAQSQVTPAQARPTTPQPAQAQMQTPPAQPVQQARHVQLPPVQQVQVTPLQQVPLAQPMPAQPMPVQPLSAQPMPVQPLSAQPMPAPPLSAQPMPMPMSAIPPVIPPPTIIDVVPQSAPPQPGPVPQLEPPPRIAGEPERRAADRGSPGPNQPAGQQQAQAEAQRQSNKRQPAKPQRTKPQRPQKTQKTPRRSQLERTPKPRSKDRDPAVDLAITEIAGHLTFTPNAVTAWYWLPEVRWAFRPDAEREALLSAISEQYAGLAGFRLHLRRTTKPFASDQWARVVDANSPYPLPTVPGAPSWSDHLVAAQRHLLSVNHAEGQTYLGITFARRTLGDTLSERIGRLFKRGVADSERRRLARTVEQFDEVLGAFGMRGRRVSADELEWLMYRSVALCMSPPTSLSSVEHGQWERGDLLALTEQIERYRTPYGTTVKLVNRITGEERHVAVLAVGRMEPLEIPERHEPWLHFHERLPWPMEISSRIDILGPGDSFRNLEHRLRLIRSQQKDYAEHGIDAPPELERLAKRALVIGDDITTGLPVDSSRAHGWHRIAVGGATRDECMERARRLTKMYSREMRVSLQHPKNQDWLAREFIPGEPLANTGYLRRMPIKLFAAALPQAASTVGDRRGDLIGRTSGTCRRPVFLDLHFPMEVRERSGLAVFVAEPGGGKSTLLGALGYLAARRGVQVTLLDPSGPLARLCAMPELAPYSRVLNLTGSEQGTLAPYALIPTPQRVHFAPGPTGDREFDIAVSNARAERRMLVQDIAMMLVPPQVAREASTATLLRHAVRQVPAEETSTLDDVVKVLRERGDHDSVELGNLLLDTAEMPLAMLFFGAPAEGTLGSDAALTVITMAGLRLPDLKIEREYWSAEESLALPMLHTAHRLAVRRCYGGEMGRRKLVGLDEAHFMEGWRSGRSFLVRLARDSRKWNLAALVSSQNPKDILGLDVQNLVSTVFVGRIAEDSEIAAEALRLLRVPTGVGYEQTLASLSQVDTASASRLGFREFVMRDVDARVQKMRVDVSYVPELLRYLDTTPAAVGTDPTRFDPTRAGPATIDPAKIDPARIDPTKVGPPTVDPTRIDPLAGRAGNGSAPGRGDPLDPLDHFDDEEPEV